MHDDKKRELVLPNHEFNRDRKVISRSINLKWNFMEFGVKYQCLNDKHHCKEVLNVEMLIS